MVKEEVLYSYLTLPYTKKFKCKCGKCRKTCCQGWKISVSEKEYYHLIGMETSPSLHQKIESSFVSVKVPSVNSYKQIAPNWLGVCPMLDSDGMCMLHKEKGASSLPTICRIYPRAYIHLKSGLNEVRYFVLSSSCEGVVEELIKSDIKLTSASLNEKAHLLTDVNDDFFLLHNKTLDIMLDGSISIKQKVTDIAKMFGIINKDDNIQAAIDIIKYALNKQRILSSEIDEFCEFINDVDSISIYRERDANIYKKFSHLDDVINKLLVNHFIYSTFPSCDERICYNDSIVGFIFAYSLLKFYIVCSEIEINTTSDLVDKIASLFHFIEHTSFYYNSYVLIKNPEKLLSL